MERLNGYRLTLAFVGFVAAVVLGDGRSNAEIIMSEPTNVGPVINDSTDVQECDFSHDGLELYFSANRPGGYGGRDIWVARRETTNDPWQEPFNLGQPVNSSAGEAEPAISAKGLELYFGLWNQWNLLVATRPSKDDPWSSPVKVGPPVGSLEPDPPVGSNDVYEPDISSDGLSLYFASSRAGGHGSDDIWVARRAAIADPWTEPVNLGSNVNSSGGEICPSISSDGLTLVFSRGVTSMWATTRKSIDDDWGPAVDLGIDNPHNFYGPALSPDGSTIYFDAHAVWGGYGDNDIWQVKFIPIVDFNSDEIVDIADLVILIEHWGEEESAYDIGPLPLGDGVVDEADLEVLMSRWGQETYDPSLIVHWRLDETEGDIAYDSARTNDAAVLGDPVWQPEGGMVDGAIAFDGIDDYIAAPFVLNPADGEFSVFAWIKGGAPGQIIISQEGGASWLMADITDGALRTDLRTPETIGRDPKPAGPALICSTVVTDGDWHRVGFVRDGSDRVLYVDDIEVARDTAETLESTSGGLYIGAASALEPGGFFSGLIDDIHIYNRAVSP
jgi:hypothetical protein